VLVASAVAAETPFARNWRRSSLEVLFSGWPSLSDADADTDTDADTGSSLPIYTYVGLRLELALRLPVRLEVLVWKPSTTLFDSIMAAIANKIR
jgi:hypothetical protein